MKSKAGFATEVELCAKFIADAERRGKWTAYAETAGWDILLVRKADGFQIGVEAKLKLNLKVVNQAIEKYGECDVSAAGPDCRAVLVPAGEVGFAQIAAYIGLTIIRCYPGNRGPWNSAFDPDLPKIGDTYFSKRDWPEWCPARRYDLPAYVPDVPAGASAPVQLTEWKIAALKIAALLDRQGYVTRADFKHIGIDHRRWVAAESGWLRAASGRYVPGSRLPDFKGQHPRVFEQIMADWDQWAPTAAEQQSLFGKAK